MFGYFWSRNATLGMAALYLVLGIVLLLFPGMSGTVFCWGMAAGAGLYAAGNFWRWHQGKKQGIQQHRIAQRRQRKEHGGSDTHALVSHLAIEPCHTEKLIAAQTAHDGNKDGRGHDTQNQAQDKDNGVDDTGGGTGNKARQPRTGTALRCRRSRSGSFTRRRLGSRCLGTIGHD